VKQTVKAARTRLRWLAYQVGCHGGAEMRYSRTTGFGSPRQERYTEYTGSSGVVYVPWKHPFYWDAEGREIPDL
jgi:hypothetical protein